MLLLVNVKCKVSGLDGGIYPPAPRSAFSSPRRTCQVLRTALLRVSTGLGCKLGRIGRDRVSVEGVRRRMEGRVGWWAVVGAVGFVLTYMLLLSPLLYRTRGGLFGGCGSVGKMSSICVSGTVVRLGPGLFVGSLCVNGMTRRLGSIRILSARSGGMHRRVTGSVHSLIRSSGCRLLVGRGDAISNSRICMGHGKDGIGRLVVMVGKTSSLGFMCVRKSVAASSVGGLVLCRDADRGFVVSKSLFCTGGGPIACFGGKGSSGRGSVKRLDKACGLGSVSAGCGRRLDALGSGLGEVSRKLGGVGVG